MRFRTLASFTPSSSNVGTIYDPVAPAQHQIIALAAPIGLR